MILHYEFQELSLQLFIVQFFLNNFTFALLLLDGVWGVPGVFGVPGVCGVEGVDAADEKLPDIDSISACTS